MTDLNNTGLARAATVMGSVAKLAKAMEVSRQVAYVWLQQGFVPNNRAQQVSDLTGVPTRELIDPELRKLLG